MFAKRYAMSASEVEASSSKICSKILDIPAIKDSGSIGIYLSFRNEVLAERLLGPLSAEGKKVFVPVVLNDGEMKFARLRPLDEMNSGLRGMKEPKEKAFAKEGEIGAFVVPGVAFDLRGFRIGWGKGHYDRFLSRNGNAVKIAPAYDFQVVRRIDAEPHDIRMDFVVTEKRVLKF
jgi:5-formyltetrahydrofolate cyclo-ligase